MKTTLAQKLAILATCGNALFNTYGNPITDELGEVVWDLRKEYNADPAFKELADSNSHLFCSDLKNFLKDKSLAA